MNKDIFKLVCCFVVGFLTVKLNEKDTNTLVLLLKTGIKDFIKIMIFIIMGSIITEILSTIIFS